MDENQAKINFAFGSTPSSDIIRPRAGAELRRDYRPGEKIQLESGEWKVKSVREKNGWPVYDLGQKNREDYRLGGSMITALVRQNLSKGGNTND